MLASPSAEERLSIPSLQEYYVGLGLSEEAWHIGPEHPGLEDLGLRLLSECPSARVLELGVQSGGFTVPVVLASSGRAGFSYTGVDNLEYTNAVRLHLIAEYLAQHGVTSGIKFIEGDSSKVLRHLPTHSSFDLILLDHYKPKYAVDLFTVCHRNLLSAEGAILLHDVLTHAAPDWKVCMRICRAFGYDWTIDSKVSQGAAIVRRGRMSSASKLLQAFVRVEVTARWSFHAAIVHGRRCVGRLLRIFGLR